MKVVFRKHSDIWIKLMDNTPIERETWAIRRAALEARPSWRALVLVAILRGLDTTKFYGPCGDDVRWALKRRPLWLVKRFHRPTRRCLAGLPREPELGRVFRDLEMDDLASVVLDRNRPPTG
jgi:hypothetical protein